MRSTIAVAAFAAGALAVPALQAPSYDQVQQAAAPAVNVVYQEAPSPVEDIVYETHIVTVTAYGDAPAATSQAAPAHYGHATDAAVAPAYSAPATSAPAADTGAAPTDYNSKVVYFHNAVRSNHSAPAVQWDDDLYNCAKTIASSCVYAHNVDVNGGGYGQNIAAGVDEDNIGSVLIDMFYNGEAPLYTYYGSEPDMGNFEGWGHFTQMVWKDTTHVACATQYCPGGLANTGGGVSPYFTVCNYKGPGNYAGQYSQNVLAPLGHAEMSNAAPGY